MKFDLFRSKNDKTYLGLIEANDLHDAYRKAHAMGYRGCFLAPMDRKVPVLFELDDGEANGLVHPFCCVACLLAAKDTIEREVEERGFTVTAGESGGIDPQAVCENCLRPIHF